MQVKINYPSHVPTHLGKSSGQKDIPKPRTPARSSTIAVANKRPPHHTPCTMVLRIRLARFGKKHAPFYNIVVAHARYVSQFPSQINHLQISEVRKYLPFAYLHGQINARFLPPTKIEQLTYNV
jgi:hypothetical protein